MAVIQAGAFHRRNYIVSGFETITIDDTAGGVALTAAAYGSLREASITVEDAQIRYTLDGTPPDATTGHILEDGDILHLHSNEAIAAFRGIRNTLTDAVLQCSYGDIKLTS